jgi:hypothetical protein
MSPILIFYRKEHAMPQHLLRWGVVMMVVLGLWMLMGWIPSAEAKITVRSAAVQNGVAVVEGRALANAPISWEGARVTQANNGGNFAFQGVVPADCVGRLEDGVPADAIDVAVANCGPVSGAVAPVPPTGQTQCWNASGALIPCAGTGQDGEIQAGVPVPSPRFTDHGDGTVIDNLTGLIWLKNADCFPGSGNGLTWEGALQAANILASGSCGLSDGSVARDWRLPNRNELQSLLDFGFLYPALSNAAGTDQWTEGDAFSNVQSTSYWSSTTIPDRPNHAWLIYLSDGQMIHVEKISITGRVWPVRGGE